MTQLYNPFKDEDLEDYVGHEDHTVVNTKEYERLKELRATCLDAPLELGSIFRVIRITHPGYAAELMSYADNLQRKAEEAGKHGQSTGRQDKGADSGAGPDTPSSAGSGQAT